MITPTTATNNNYNNKEIKLNCLIFTDISKYLLYDNESFSTVLEYSLLSKYTFKIFQSLLSSPSHEFKYKLGTFLKYIGIGNNKEHDNDETYKLKLIQYKEIEILRISGSHLFMKTKKGLLLDKCKNLKQVILLDYIDARSKINYDFTLNGFFKVMKLSSHFELWSPPLSQNEQIDINSVNYNFQVENFEYSFEYLGKYNPLKINLTTSIRNKLRIKIMDYIFNCKSIEKINFSQATTPYQFLKKSLGSKNPLIKSLTVRLIKTKDSPTPSFELIEILNSDGSDGSGNNIIQKHLNKLRLRKLPFEDHHRGWDDDEGLIKLLNILKNNSNCKITKLGLEVFNIKHSNLLLPLIEMTNISTIYCDTLNLEVWLDHCNQNPNIKKLVHFETGNIKKLVRPEYSKIDNNNPSFQIINKSNKLF